MEMSVCHELLMPQNSHCSCFVKISNQMKATPNVRPDPRFKAKTLRGQKLAALNQQTAGSPKCATFSLQISGANTRGPFEQIPGT